MKIWCGVKGKCVQHIPIELLVVFSCMFFILFANFGTTLCSASPSSLSSPTGDEYSWKQWKQNSLGRSTKPRYSADKQMTTTSSKKVSKSKSSNAANFVTQKRARKTEFPGDERLRGKMESSMVQPRQGGGGGGGGWGWGGGWPSSYGGSGGSYDVYTIIAVAAFAALFGALIYELLGGSLRRSYEPSLFGVPPVSLGLDSEKLPEVMVKIGDWIANSSWFDNLTNDSRAIKDLSEKIGVRKWFDAFKKDPVEYQCIRKLACETLATSPLAEKSLRTNFGTVFIAAFGNFIENGNELQDLVKQVVGNPKKCDELVTGGYCEEN